jgi:hypothetical protein
MVKGGGTTPSPVQAINHQHPGSFWQRLRRFFTGDLLVLALLGPPLLAYGFSI